MLIPHCVPEVRVRASWGTPNGLRLTGDAAGRGNGGSGVGQPRVSRPVILLWPEIVRLAARRDKSLAGPRRQRVQISRPVATEPARGYKCRQCRIPLALIGS